MELREKSQPVNRRFLSHLVVFLLIGATLAVFRPVGAFEFVNYDDGRYVAANPYLLKGFSLEGVRWAFSADLAYDPWILKRKK